MASIRESVASFPAFTRPKMPTAAISAGKTARNQQKAIPAEMSVARSVLNSLTVRRSVAFQSDPVKSAGDCS